MTILWRFDYTLQFPKSSRKKVIEALRPLCSSDTEMALAGLNNPSPVEVIVAFRSKSDMPAMEIKEYPKLESGDRRLDGIHIRLSRSKWRGMSYSHEFRIWPSSPKLQDAFFGSQLLRKELIGMLKQYRGYAGYLVIDEQDPTGFWHRSDKRYKEENVLVYFPRPLDVATEGGLNEV